MRTRTAGHLAGALVALLLLAGCGTTGDDDEGGGDEGGGLTTEATTESTTTTEAPTTTEPGPPTDVVTYTEGTAEVQITGGDEGTAEWELSLDPDNESLFDPEGDLALYWIDPSTEDALEFTAAADGGLEEGVIDAFTRIEVGGPDNPYVDSFHTLCTVELTTFTEEAVEGTFTCEGLEAFSAETEGQTIDVEGTFSASP